MTHLLATRSEKALSKTWPGTRRNGRAARHWLRQLLAAEHDETRDTCETVVAELVANALRHTASGQPGGRFEVTIDPEHPFVDPAHPLIWIGVRDEGSTTAPVAAPPEQLAAEELPEGGFGLALILGGLAAQWGFEEFDAGRLTYAVVARS